MNTVVLSILNVFITLHNFDHKWRDQVNTWVSLIYKHLTRKTVLFYVFPFNIRDSNQSQEEIQLSKSSITRNC